MSGWDKLPHNYISGLTAPDIDVTNKLKMDEIVKFEQYLKDGNRVFSNQIRSLKFHRQRTILCHRYYSMTKAVNSQSYQ